MLLDRLGAETAALGHLLDDSFEAVFRPAERRLRDQLREVRDIARHEEVRPALKAAVLSLVAQFGNEDDAETNPW